jgi:uncharacterized membrane protein
MRRFLLVMISCLRITAILVALVIVTAAHGQTINTFDAPNSYSTILVAINSAGQIAGNYTDAHRGHGFLREANGTFTAIDMPSPTRGTQVTGMNDSGEVIGYDYPGFSVAPFVRRPDGTIGQPCVSWSSKASAAMSPLLAPLPFDGNIPQAINNLGQIVGVGGGISYSSYLSQPDGTCVTIRLSPWATYARAINVFGAITGNYEDLNSSFWRGFLREANGQITTFDAPGSISTFPTAIDQKGHVAGNYSAADGVHGFLRKPNGQIETFDPFGSVETIVVAMNQKGQITGYYATTDGVYHGFLRDKNGEIEAFDAPCGANCGTFPEDINDLGEIVGYYQDANSAPHGFIRSNDKERKGHLQR